MRFEITLISLLGSVFGAICAGELFLAQLTPHSVNCREPAILRLELHRVLTAAAFENAVLERSAPPYLHRTARFHRTVYVRQKQGTHEKGQFQKRFAKVLITPVFHAPRDSSLRCYGQVN
jgi:hypothetical protein